jgi:hypothetical protein
MVLIGSGENTSSDGVLYLIKRARSLVQDAMDPLLEKYGFTFLQYLILAWLVDGVAVNPKDIRLLYCHDGGR